MLLLDSERFCAACGDTAWSQAVTRKNDLFTSAGKAILPGADVEYYSFGGVIRSPSASGWGQSGEWFTFREQMDIFAVSLCEPSLLRRAAVCPLCTEGPCAQTPSPRSATLARRSTARWPMPPSTMSRG